MGEMSPFEQKAYNHQQNINASNIIFEFLVDKMKTEEEFYYDILLDELYITKIVEKLRELGYSVNRPIVNIYRNRICIEKKLDLKTTNFSSSSK